MDIQHRREEIEKLVANVIQDYFGLIAKENWESNLYNVTKDKINNNQRIGTITEEVFKSLKYNGKEAFSLKNMDVSLIFEIINEHDEKIVDRIDPQIYNLLVVIKDIRNTYSHSSHNEEDDELFSLAAFTLAILKQFIRAIDNKLKIRNDLKENFILIYSKRINELNNLICDEYFERYGIIKEFKKEIENVLADSKKFPFYIYSKENTEKSSSVWKQPALSYKFHMMAIEAGIFEAYSFVITYCFYELKDYNLGFDLMLKQLKNANCKKTDLLGIIDTLNHYLLMGNTHIDVIDTIIAEIVARGYPIEKTDDGLYFIVKNK